MAPGMDNATLELLSAPPRRSYDNLFGVILFITILLFFGAGLYLRTVKPLPVTYEEKRVMSVTTQFVVPEKKKPPAPKPKPVSPEKEKEPVDLTKAPLLNQKQDFTAPVQNAPVQIKDAARPVFGLRRVYSMGIGAGGSVSDAVIGKLGNTLDKDVDTVTATKKDLAGPLVSITTVATAPRLRKEIKPEYTKEMIDAKVQGVVRAELLVGGDGKVKEVKILNDLGYGTRESARKLFLSLEFDPAMRDGKPVATWITFSIRYVLLQE
jgi:Gram-negative bacterial TonB protein C-terminal